MVALRIRLFDGKSSSSKAKSLSHACIPPLPGLQAGRAHRQTASALWSTCLLSLFQVKDHILILLSWLRNFFSASWWAQWAGWSGLLSAPGFPGDQYSVGRGSHICLSPWMNYWPPSPQGFWCLHSDEHESCSTDRNRTLEGQAFWRLGWTGFLDSEHLSVTSILLDLLGAGWTSTSLTALEFSGMGLQRTHVNGAYYAAQAWWGGPVFLLGSLTCSQALSLLVYLIFHQPWHIIGSPIQNKEIGIHITRLQIWSLGMKPMSPASFFSALSSSKQGLEMGQCGRVNRRFPWSANLDASSAQSPSWVTVGEWLHLSTTQSLHLHQRYNGVHLISSNMSLGGFT